jgi:hypothetical protein
VLGLKKRASYGLVLVLQLAAALSRVAHYAAPFEDGNILYFPGLPMLAACWILYLLRDQDTILSLK